MGVFNPKIAPSHEALRAASMLGNQMARRESRLAPDLRNASRFGDFSQFRIAHRDKLERSDIFRTWQEKLFNLAEREGRRFGLRLDDSMTAWDIWYNQVVQPLRKEMWTSWEAWHDMPERYHAAAAEQRQRQSTATILHVAARVADTTHLVDVGSQTLSVPETAGPAVPATAPQRPTADNTPEKSPAKVAPTLLQADNAPVPLAMGSVKGITPDNQISLAGDSWSI